MRKLAVLDDSSRLLKGTAASLALDLMPVRDVENELRLLRMRPIDKSARYLKGTVASGDTKLFDPDVTIHAIRTRAAPVNARRDAFSPRRGLFSHSLTLTWRCRWMRLMKPMKPLDASQAAPARKFGTVHTPPNSGGGYRVDAAQFTARMLFLVIKVQAHIRGLLSRTNDHSHLHTAAEMHCTRRRHRMPATRQSPRTTYEYLWPAVCPFGGLVSTRTHCSHARGCAAPPGAQRT